MRVDPLDGRCRVCGGVLEVTYADDATMTVECIECGDSYPVEPDAFNDGCMTYYVGFMTAKAEAGEDGDE